MTAVGNLFRLIDRQEFAGQVCLNVYYYKLALLPTPGGTVSTDLGHAFQENILPLILPVQVEGVTHTLLEVANLDDPGDFDIIVLTTDNVGTAGTDGLPPYAAGSIRLNRGSRASRNGQKRYVGVPETAQSNGTVTVGYTNAMNDLAEVVGESLADSITSNEWIPRIVRKDRDAPYAILGDFPVQDAQFVALTTQNTRKIGRGI